MFDSLFDELSSSFDEVLEECNLLIDKEFKGLSSQQKTKEKSFSDHALIFAPNSAPTPPSTSTFFTSSSSSSSSKILSCSSSLLPRLLAKASETEVISNGKQPATTPCSLCGRKFLPERLPKHIEVCKKTKQKKRKPFDSKQQRKVDDNDVSPSSPTHHNNNMTNGSHRETTTTKSSITVSSISSARKSAGGVRGTTTTSTPVKKTNWREQHEEFIRTVRAARGVNVDLEEDNKGGKTSKSSVTNSSNYDPVANGIFDAPKKVPAGYIKCPTCERSFNRKAADRHIEWCKEQAKYKRLKSPVSSTDAMAKFKARTTYKANGSTPNLSNIRKPSTIPTASPVIAKKVTTPVMSRRTMEKTAVVGKKVNTHRSVSPSKRLNGMSGSNTTNSKVKAIMESNRLKAAAPKTPIVKFKDKFPGSGKSVTSQYMQETESLKELLKRPDVNFSSAPRTVPGVRTGGMSPTRVGGFDGHPSDLNTRSNSFSSSMSLMKRSLDDLYISQQSNGRETGALTKNSNRDTRTNGSSSRNGHRGSTSGSSAGAREEEEHHAVNQSGPMPRWCHQCGTKYPMTSAKYCYECGARRLGSLASLL